MQTDMTGKVALVTGGAGGIGEFICERLAQAGGTVLMLDVDESKAKETLGRLDERLGAAAQRIQFVLGDLNDLQATDQLAQDLVKRHGTIDVLVNNAGVHRGGKIHRLTDNAWHEVLQVNLTGAMNMTRAAVPQMSEGCAVVNVGAVVGFRGFPGDSAYASSKAGLSGLTKALAIELAPKAITANLVIPGLVLTEMTSELSEAALDKMTQQIPLRRFAEDREVAEVVCWVAQSRYMTGAVVPVDDGLLSSFGEV